MTKLEAIRCCGTEIDRASFVRTQRLLSASDYNRAREVFGPLPVIDCEPRANDMDVVLKHLKERYGDG